MNKERPPLTRGQKVVLLDSRVLTVTAIKPGRREWWVDGYDELRITWGAPWSAVRSILVEAP